MDDLTKQFLGMTALSAVTFGGGFALGRLTRGSASAVPSGEIAPSPAKQRGAEEPPPLVVFPSDAPGHFYIVKARIRRENHVLGYFVDDVLADRLRDQAATWNRTSQGGFFLTFADRSAGELAPERRFVAPGQVGALYKVQGDILPFVDAIVGDGEAERVELAVLMPTVA